MIESEAFKLLTLASARDGRKVSPSVAKVWAGDLARVDLDVAVEAATLHYRESSDWLMPVHVIRNARRVLEARERVARLRRQLEPEVREFSDEGIKAYWAEVERLKELKTAGES
jgi:transposase